MSNGSASLLAFVANCRGASWDRLGLAWVQFGPLTRHKLGQISSHKGVSTIFVDQRFALVLFKRVLVVPIPSMYCVS